MDTLHVIPFMKKPFQNTKNEITYNFDMQHETRLSACIYKFITKQRCFVVTNMKPILGQTICFFSPFCDASRQIQCFIKSSCSMSIFNKESCIVHLW